MNCHVCGIKQKKEFTYKKYKYYKCPNCKLVSTYPFPNEKVIIKHYNDKFIDGNYNLNFKSTNQYLSVHKQFLQILQSFTKRLNFKRMKILDIGCFTGDFLYLMKKKGADVRGVELQDEAVTIANNKLGNKVIAIDITKKNVKMNNFDVITLFGLIEHVTHPAKVISSSSRILKKNGLIMIQTPNSNSLFAKLMKQYWPPYSPVEHIHLFSRQSLEQLLINNGLKPEFYTPHIKRLPIKYVYSNLENFGPEFYKIAKIFSPLINSPLGNIRLPFYIGEMIIIARKIN